MLSLISPAKKLLTNFKSFPGTTTSPEFLDEAESLIKLMQTKSLADIAGLMDLSPALAQLNFDRYQNFYFKQSPLDASYPALLLFQGDVYQGLQAKTLSSDDFTYAEEHLAILSGLYGLLRPMDSIQPYRLEMGVKLQNSKGANLYDFWSEKLTAYLNKQLASHKNPVLINLASTEYFKAVQQKKLTYPIVTVNFYEQKNNEVKMIGIYAKKARGLMARYIVQQRVDDLAQLKQFSEQGYRFNEQRSTEFHLDFVREHTK